MDDYYDMEDSMLPERDVSNMGFSVGEEILGNLEQDSSASQMIMKTSTAAFNQQRSVVAKLARGELEDRYLRLLEENVVLKKHAVKQEEKIKKLATKLIRVMSDKKRLEMGGGGNNTSNVRGGHRDLETEELIEDQQQRIRELERTTGQLKDKLLVAKQQILAVNQQQSSTRSSKRPTAPSVVASSRAMMHSPMMHTPSLLMPSPTPQSQQQLLSQQAQHLLEEARNENRLLEESVNMLKEQLNMMELEVEQTHEQAKIKEANYEEEVTILKDQLKERSYQDVAENIELIRLQQDKKSRTTQLTTLKAQIQGFEEQVSKLKLELEKLKNENGELNNLLGEEQRKVINLSSECSTNSSSKQALMESEEKLRDAQKENSILRESNAKLLDSAYNVERERQFTAAENALKVQVAQLETTLKADLTDKKMLSEALASERENNAKLDSDYQDLQSKFFALKENMEGHSEKLQFFAKENSIEASDLEQALLSIKQRPTSGSSSSQPSRLAANTSSSAPLDFLESSGDGKREIKEDEIKQLRSELSQIQAHHVEAVNELEKTRSLLRVQANINQEQKNEIEAMHQRILQLKAEFQSQIVEYKKLLDLRATRIHKLEMQLRDHTYGQVPKTVSAADIKSQTVHTPSGQSLFEIHIQKVNLTRECLLHLGASHPGLFATWTFFEHDMQYTPVIKGPQAQLDCSAYYKVKLDEAFLDYLMDSSVMVEIHMTSQEADPDQPQCRSVGQAELKLTEVVHYPSNKLHGSVLVIAPPQTDKEPKVIGSLDYWFKLHTAATSKIQEWLDHREEVQRALDAMTNESPHIASEVDLLQGEQRAIKLPENQEKLIGRKKEPDPEPVQPPQILIKKPEREKVSKRERKLKKSKGVDTACEEEPIKEPESKDQSQSNEELTKPTEEKFVESTTKPDEVEKQESKKAVVAKSIDEEVKPTPKPRAPAPLEIDSQEIKEKSEWDSDNEEGVKIGGKDEQVASSSGKKAEESANENQGHKEMDTTGKIDEEVEDSQSEEEEESESDEEEEESDEESESEEEGDDDDEETESEEESDDNEKANAERRSTPEMEERKIERKPTTKEDSISDNDLSMTTASSEPIVRRVKELATTSQDDSAATTTGGESSSTSHDSEGVVVRRASLAGGGKGSTVLGNEAITITITEFKAGKNANFLKNKKIQKLFVEYSFLDLKAEETETPFALPKPQTAGESIVFNFSKVIPLDKQNHGSRRRLLTKILSNEKPSDASQDDQASGKSSKAGKNQKCIVFSLVSEPDETEGKDGKCEDVGTATVDLEAIDKSGQDLVDAVLDVHSVEPQTRVSKFLGSKKIIGTLTVSVLAVDVFNSLKL